MTASMALVHEWLDAPRGAEKVFLAMCDTFPDADRYALSVSPEFRSAVRPAGGGLDVRTTWLDRPGWRDRRGVTLPLMPLAWRSLPRERYDVVLTSHHAFASSNRLARRRHLVYVHSPARYVWTPELDARGGHWGLKPVRSVLRAVDRAAAARVTSFAANSREVADRVRRSWGRPAVVIHPPVDTAFYAPSGPAAAPARDGGYLLFVGRLVPYKRPDFAIELAARMRCRLVVVGDGPLLPRLRQQARRLGAEVDFRTRTADDEVRQLYRDALALVFPAVEDFGIVPVEAQACGTPVVALDRAGAQETVRSGESGVLVEDLDLARFERAVGLARTLSPEACVRNAGRFAPAAFEARLRDWVEESSR